MTYEQRIARVERAKEEAIQRVAELKAEIRRLKMELGIYSPGTRKTYNYQDRKAAGEEMRRGPSVQKSPPDDVMPIIQTWEAGRGFSEIAQDRGVSRRGACRLIAKWELRGHASRAKHEAARAEIQRRMQDAAQ